MQKFGGPSQSKVTRKSEEPPDELDHPKDNEEQHDNQEEHEEVARKSELTSSDRDSAASPRLGLVERALGHKALRWDRGGQARAERAREGLGWTNKGPAPGERGL